MRGLDGDVDRLNHLLVENGLFTWLVLLLQDTLDDLSGLRTLNLNKDDRLGRTKSHTIEVEGIFDGLNSFEGRAQLSCAGDLPLAVPRSQPARAVTHLGVEEDTVHLPMPKHTSHNMWHQTRLPGCALPFHCLDHPNHGLPCHYHWCRKAP